MSDINIDNFSLDDIEDPFEVNMEENNIEEEVNQSGGANNDPKPEPDNDDESSFDPEELSPESVDPEEDSPKSVELTPEDLDEDLSDVDIEEKEDTSEAVEEDVGVREEEIDGLPSNEIILDDEDIIIDIEEGIEINDEEIIPEEKVIANEKDQSEDLFNEIMKMVPEKYRTNRTYIKRAQTLVKSCLRLKGEVSKDEVDPTNIFRLMLNIKQTNNKPNLEKLIKLDFSDTNILPIVDDRKEMYDILVEEYADLLNGSLDEFNEETSKFVNVKNDNKINTVIKLRNNYKTGSSRFNYSYNEEFRRLHDILLPYRIGNSDSNLVKRLDNDTRVYRNSFTQDPISYNKLKLEQSKLSSHTVLENDDINIVGFIRLPKNIKDLKNLNKIPLSSLVSNNTTNYDFFKKIGAQNIIENLKIDIEVGDSVILNFNTEGANLVINGVVDEYDSDTNSIVVIPEEEGDKTPKKLKIQLDDPSVDVINTALSSRTTQINDSSNMKVFLFGENGDSGINDYRLRKYLMEVIPSTNNVLEVLRKKSKFPEFNFKMVQDTLLDFNVSLNDFVHTQLVELIKILRDNINRDLKETERTDISYNRLIKNPPTPPRADVTLIYDKSLKSVENLYGQYPFYNQPKDSDSTRLLWLRTRIDNGEYYFKNIVKNIIEKFKFEPDEIITKIQEKRQKLLQDLYLAESDIERTKQNLIYNDNKCPENRIVKVYTNYKDLDNDNESGDVKIDEDKRIYGEYDHRVKVGMFAILDVDNKKKLFKREVVDDKEIWVLEPNLDPNHLLNENRDFCEYQQKKIEELNASMINFGKCAFNEIENSCVSKELDAQITKKYDLENRIKDLDINIASLQDDKEKEPIDVTLERLERLILASNKLAQRKYQNFEKDKAEEKAKEIEPEYEMLYKKIDLYLEKISRLENVEKYNLLNILIQKYGREAIDTNEPKENPLNVYCKYGNKVLCCTCDKRMIEIFQDDDSNFDEGLNRLLDELGVEEDGMYWCKNCGREIHISEYETTEGFNKNGARDVTHAIVEDDDEAVPSRDKNTELYDSLKAFLILEDGGITTDNKLDIMKIYKAVLEQMGIKLSEEDEINLLRTVSGICLTNIKPKVEWSTTFKGKPKSLDKAYNVYTNVNTIMYTVSYLFLILQSSLPEYKISKMHQKCVPSLEGIPMSESGNAGINYLKCILENLMVTKDEMSALKKIKLEQTLTSTILKLSTDEYIKYRYRKKQTQALIDNDESAKIDPLNVWNEFRPPLSNYDIKNSQIDAMSPEELISKKGIDRRNVKNYLSLKLISEIDKNVNKEAVENFLFNPALMGNSCCLSQIAQASNYINFFLDNDKIKELYTKIGFVYSKESSVINDNTILKTYNKDEYTYPTFKNNVFPSREDIEEAEIKGLFETYVHIGEFVGLKRIYYNDTCIYTNQSRKDILSKDYTYDQYIELLKTIQKLNLQQLNDYRVENKLEKTQGDNTPPKTYEVESDLNEINTLKNLIVVLSKNQVLSSDGYLNKFFDLLRNESDLGNIADLWSDLTAQLKVLIDEIKTSVSESLGESVGNKVEEQLIQLGELREIFEDNKMLKDYIYAKRVGTESKIRLIKKYLYTYLFAIPKKIKNDMGSSDLDPKEKPDNWNISQNYLNKLDDILKTNNYICDSYIIEKRSNDYQIIYDSLASFINNNNKELRKLTAKEHEYTCEGAIKIYSKCFNRNLARLLHYVFVLIFKEMLNLDIVIADKINRGVKKVKKSKMLSNGEELPNIKINGNDVGEVVDELDTIESAEDLVSKVDREEKMDTEQRSHLVNLMVDILNDINNDRMFLDKHSKTRISENIEKKLESEKEANLDVMKHLDKESRQSLTNMIKMGQVSWKNLANLTDLDLRFGETVEEGGANDPANGDNDFLPIIAEEEVEENLQQRARDALGDNYTREEYDNWNERRLLNEREDKEAMIDGDVMSDDDGDDFEMEAQGDDAYY